MTPEERAKELSKRANASGYISEDHLVEIQLAAIKDTYERCAEIAHRGAASEGGDDFDKGWRRGCLAVESAIREAVHSEMTG